MVGPMFSGKSEWLVNRLRMHSVAGDQILAIRFSDDNRYGKSGIISHNKTKFEAASAKSSKDIKILTDQNNFQVLAIDEVQFFDPSLIELLLELQLLGKSIYATGLDTDFTATPWETTMRIMALSDLVEKRVAVCSVCKKLNATRTQRLLNGKPASKKSPRVLIGGKESYTARCIIHHQVPD